MSDKVQNLCLRALGKRWPLVRPHIPLKLLRQFINLLQGIFPPLILQDQDSFAGEAGAEELLALLPAAQTEPLRKKWTANPDKSSEEKWDDIKNQVKVLGKTAPAAVSSLVDTDDSDGDFVPLRRNFFSWLRWKI